MRSVMSGIPQARGASPRLANEGFAGDATFSPARWRRDAKSLTRRRDRPPTPATTSKSRRRTPLRQSAAAPWPRRARACTCKLKRSKPSFGRGKIPSARPARKTSLFGRRPLEGRQRPKKPGPSLLQAASPVWRGTPVRLRLPVFQGRLTGLLSRSPPTDTRPQARAYWASDYLCESRLSARGFFKPEPRILRQRRKIVHFRVCVVCGALGPAEFRR